MMASLTLITGLKALGQAPSTARMPTHTAHEAVRSGCGCTENVVSRNESGSSS